MEFSLKFKLSEKDFIDFNKSTVWTLPLLEKIFLSVLAVCYLGPCVILFIFEIKLDEILKMFFPVLLIIILAFLYFCFLWPKLLRKSYNSDKTIQDEQTLVLSEASICQSSSKGGYTVPVQDLYKIRFFKNCIALYIGRNKAIVIPKHCFASKEEEMQVENFIKEKYVLNKK